MQQEDIRSGLVSQINLLSQQKRETSRQRRIFKSDNDPAERGYSHFFWESDLQRLGLRKKLRLLHLANNFLIGRPYKKIEQKIAEENRLFPSDCRYIVSLIQQYTQAEVQLEELKDWVRQGDVV